MNQKNYDLMNWEEIESIIYGDCNNPQDILGVSTVGKKKLIQCFYPSAEEVKVIFEKSGKKTSLELEKVDDEGFFAEFFTSSYDSYSFEIKYEDKTVNCMDPYAFKVLPDETIIKNIIKGEANNANEILGAHKKVYEGVEGYEFVVYAPYAQTVSLVGDFNNWNENANLMILEKSGVFALFVPGLKDDSQYKYVIKSKGFKAYRNDPFAYGIINNNSVCKDFKLSDKPRNISKKGAGLQILEIDLKSTYSKFNNVKDTTKFIVNKVKDYKYDTVVFLPVLKNAGNDIYDVYNEFSFDEESGLNASIFAEICKDISDKNINVILELPLAYVSDNENGISFFDGSHLFENDDYRLNSHKKYNAMLFDYNNEFTSSYLNSAVNFFMTNFCIDGILIPNAGVILYHDYNKNPGEYITEEWGNTINSSGVNFLKSINKKIHKNYKNAITIASIYAYFNNVTGKDKDSLGFDYCINSGSTDELLDFLKYDPSNRREHLDTFLLFTHLYNDKEKYIYPFSKKENEKNGLTIFDSMPGSIEEKLANYKIAIIFKHLMRGSQLSDIMVDSIDTENEKLNKSFDKFLVDFRDIYNQTKDFVKNTDTEAFKYKCIDNQVVTREYMDGKKHYVLVFNFSTDSFKEYVLPVSKEGVYTEAFNSDDKKYGGKGLINKKPIMSEEIIEDSMTKMTLSIPALSVSAFSYREFNEEELEQIYQNKKKKAYAYVENETIRIEKQLDADIEALKKSANLKIKELEMLLKPYDH